MGKNWKFHKTGKGLNQYTGSKQRALKFAKPFKIGGMTFFFVQGVWISIDLMKDFNWNKVAFYGKDLGLDAIGSTGLPGMILSIYFQTSLSFIEMRQTEILQVLGNHSQDLEYYLLMRTLEDIQTFRGL